jgi:hypothetical protein
MNQPTQRCTGLIKMTNDALTKGVLAVMLMSAQKDNLELSIYQAIKW